MRYRKLDANGDYSFGQGSADFYVDQPEAVAQAVATRLGLYLGEWFLDVTDGTDWRGSVLGAHTETTRDMVLKARILGTLNLSAITAYASSVVNRAFSVSVQLSTAYDNSTVTGSAFVNYKAGAISGAVSGSTVSYGMLLPDGSQWVGADGAPLQYPH